MRYLEYRYLLDSLLSSEAWVLKASQAAETTITAFKVDLLPVLCRYCVRIILEGGRGDGGWEGGTEGEREGEREAQRQANWQY